MKNYFHKGLFFGLLLFFSFGYSTQDSSLCVVTANVRREGKEVESQYLWKNRKNLFCDQIKSLKPDVIGFQETIKPQINDISQALPSYGWVGQSRGSKAAKLWHKFVMKFAKDEYAPLFYNKERVTLVEFGTFAVNPSGMCHHIKDLPRVCTWALFQDKKTGKRFYVYNTHLDNKKQHIREKQMDIIFKHIHQYAQKDLPILLMGDLNMNIVDGVYSIFLAEHFELAKLIAQKIEGPEHTRTGWKNEELKAIDHILMRKTNNEKVLSHCVVESPIDQLPSDHRPVCVTIQL